MRNLLFITKYRLRSTFFLQFVVVFVTCAFIFDKVFIERPKSRKSVLVQTDLLNYNEDGLRPTWPFKISKHYDVRTLRTYKSKPRILTQFDLPGERGEFESLCRQIVTIVLNFQNQWFSGTPVLLSPVLQDLADVSFDEYKINVVASNKVANNRSLPDFRDPKCLNIKYPTHLPSTSVIMVSQVPIDSLCFHR